MRTLDRINQISYLRRRLGRFLPESTKILDGLKLDSSDEQIDAAEDFLLSNEPAIGLCQMISYGPVRSDVEKLLAHDPRYRDHFYESLDEMEADDLAILRDSLVDRYIDG